MPYAWQRILHIPASLQGWEQAYNQFTGRETYGDPDDDSKFWATGFDTEVFWKVKIETGDESFRKLYFTGNLIDNLLKDISLAEIKEKGGLNVYYFKEHDGTIHFHKPCNEVELQETLLEFQFYPNEWRDDFKFKI